jgi:hypothetical protein
MTRAEHLENLYFALYQYFRWPDPKKFAGLDDKRRGYWRGASNQVIENIIASITWGLAQPDLDFRTIIPTLPKDRAEVVRFMEMMRADLQEVLKMPPRTP